MMQNNYYKHEEEKAQKRESVPREPPQDTEPHETLER